MKMKSGKGKRRGRIGAAKKPLVSELAKVKEFEAKPELEALEPFEDLEGWMDEQHLRRGSWKQYPGAYEKEFCDVRKADGTEVGPCWPNAGKFVRIDGAQEVEEKDVAFVRYYEPRGGMRDRDDDEGDKGIYDSGD